MALIAAWVAELSILVVKAEKPADEGEEIEVTLAEEEGEFELNVDEVADDEIEIIIHDEMTPEPGMVNINSADAAELASKILELAGDTV